MINKEEILSRMSDFERVCREFSVKLTHQRREIFREIAATEKHPDVEFIYGRVKKRIPEISLDTVYRTMWMLRDMGLLGTLGSAGEKVRFDANMRKHHHFRCSRCGSTRDFYSEELDSLKLPDEIKNFGRIDATQVEVRGLCEKCMQQQPPTRASRKKEKV